MTTAAKNAQPLTDLIKALEAQIQHVIQSPDHSIAGTVEAGQHNLAVAVDVADLVSKHMGAFIAGVSGDMQPVSNDVPHEEDVTEHLSTAFSDEIFSQFPSPSGVDYFLQELEFEAA